VRDGNGIILAHVYGQPVGAIAVSNTSLTNDEARRISKLISRLPSWSRPSGTGTGPILLQKAVVNRPEP
jgi:hypothetical protein